MFFSITLPSSLSTQCRYQLQQPNDLLYHIIGILLQTKHALLERVLYSKTPCRHLQWVTDTAGTPTIMQQQSTHRLQGWKGGHQQGTMILRCIYSHNPSPSLCCEQRSAEILKGLKKMLKCLGGTGLQLLSSSVFLAFAWLAPTIRGEKDADRYLPISCTSPGTDLW